MNVAFDLPKDRSWRENDPVKMYKFVSLWNMLQYHAHVFMKMFNHLSLIENIIGVRELYEKKPIQIAPFSSDI